jgi:hypothetical protein
MTNSDLLRKLCKADPLRFALKEDHSVGRWDNVLRSPVGATFLNSDYTPNTQADQWSWNALMWSLLMEQIARLAELNNQDAALTPMMEEEVNCLSSRLTGRYEENTWVDVTMYETTPRYIIETQIAWSECRKQEVGS